MKFAAPRHRDTEAGVLPLINVVFLLLIFFMIAGSLSPLSAFDIAPPQSANDADVIEKQVVLLISGDKQLALGDDVITEGVLAETLKARGQGAEPFDLQLKADAGLDAQYLIHIMTLLREAGVDKLELLTVKGDEA